MSAALLAKVRSRGFTPGRRDLDALLALLGEVDETDAAHVTRALAQVPDAAVRAEASLAAAQPPQRHRLVGLLAKMRGDGAVDVLLRALADDDPRTRKAAARGLGRAQDSSVRSRAAAALAGALATEARPEVKRAVVEAIGKVGGAAELAALERLGEGEGVFEQTRAEAAARIERGRARSLPSRIVDDRPAAQPFDLVLRCREGLEGLLAEEMPGARVLGPGRVRARVRSLREATVAHVWSSVALPLYEGPDLVDERVAELIAGAAPKLEALTQGAVRYRIEWIGAGHKRAATRALAQGVARSSLVNDPIASDWEIEIARGARGLRVEAVPKSWDDRRFAYRVADVPAASHPTIAAALARAAGVRQDDVVWDPFVGSGLELIERARLGPYRELVGTDVDERALAAAKKNLASARVQGARLAPGDARTFDPGRVSLVLTNPPMGRRIPARPGGRAAAGESARDAFLTDVLRNVTRRLERGGRLVWITPRARHTRRVLEQERLVLEASTLVAMGGFTATLERWKR